VGKGGREVAKGKELFKTGTVEMLNWLKNRVGRGRNHGVEIWSLGDKPRIKDAEKEGPAQGPIKGRKGAVLGDKTSFLVPKNLLLSPTPLRSSQQKGRDLYFPI